MLTLTLQICPIHWVLYTVSEKLLDRLRRSFRQQWIGMQLNGVEVHSCRNPNPDPRLLIAETPELRRKPEIPPRCQQSTASSALLSFSIDHTLCCCRVKTTDFEHLPDSELSLGPSERQLLLRHAMKHSPNCQARHHLHLQPLDLA
jgi:hypothetical protein